MRSPSSLPLLRLPSIPGSRVTLAGTLMVFSVPLRENFPSTVAVAVSPVILKSDRLLTVNLISGWVVESIQSLPCMCSFMAAFSTCSDGAAMVMTPLVASGFSRSMVRVPETPLAEPVMVSSTASSLKVALFTPLGSLKSNVCSAAWVAGPAASKVAASRRVEARMKVDEFMGLGCRRPVFRGTWTIGPGWEFKFSRGAVAGWRVIWWRWSARSRRRLGLGRLIYRRTRAARG